MNNIKNDNTQIMGILNLTPDSFYDGNSSISNTQYKDKLTRIKNADILDVGAESSRPGSRPITIKEEINRLNYFFDNGLKHDFLSIDSYKPKVIDFCLNNGFDMVNDISGGGINFENIDIAKSYNVPICIMHMLGNPYNMQVNPKYDNIIDDIMSFFDQRVNYFSKIGYDLKKLILDPGIGFGKTKEDNYNIISNVYKFKKFGCKLLIGISRKSFLQVNNDIPKDRLYSSIAMQSICAYKGVDIIRTHDVNEMINSINVISQLNNNYGNSRLYK